MFLLLARHNYAAGAYFIIKNGYSDLVVMSRELYDEFARMNRIDQAIFESEQEIGCYQERMYGG